MNNLKAGIGCLGAIVVGALFFILTAFVTVPPGNVGVVTTFGEVQDATLPAGTHFVIPFMNNVIIVDARVQSHEFGVADNLPIEAASSEYQSVYLSGKFNYHVDGAYASVLYKTVGSMEDFADRIIDPAFKDIVKEVVPTYKIGDILGKRDEIRTKTKDLLNANLARYHIIIDDVYLANIGFSPEYEAAIEAKQVAQQQVETEREVLKQLEVKKDQRRVEAEGNATAAIENARGTAEANRLLTESLSPLLIQYEALRKLNPNVQVIYLPESGNFLLQVPAPPQAAP